MIGKRKAFKQAILAYVCAGGLLGLSVAFYGTSRGREMNEIVVISLVAIEAAASLIVLFLQWRHIKKEEPVRPIYLHYLLPRKCRRWMLGESETGLDH